MPVFNQSRSRIIKGVFIFSFLVIIARLFYLQVLSSKYGRLAKDNAILEKTDIPPRGLVFDRHKKLLVNNTLAYDLMVTPALTKGIDTAYFCKLMEIDTAEFNDRVLTSIIKAGRQVPSVFEASLNPQKYARMQANLWRFGACFEIDEKPVRSYPFTNGANIFGYTGEVDSAYLKRHADDNYRSGEYAGMSGLEASYEKVLKGEKGIKVLLKDKNNRVIGPFKNGTRDVKASAGNNLYTSIDIELQQYGEKLMEGKVGSIVAIDPRTGGILALVSSPTYDPGYLTGPERGKHIRELNYLDPRLPLFNRAVSATYSPGSTFKTLQALVGLHEGVITTSTTFSCGGAFYGCGSAKPMKCLDPGTFSLQRGITWSCNTYFATVMQRVINNPKYPNVDSSLRAWDNYMYGFGLGHKLGVDLPSEKSGNIPTPEYFNNPKRFGPGKWGYCSFRSVSIGQGEVTATPVQVANEMAYIANKGWYYIPHIVDSVEGGDEFGLLAKYKVKQEPIDIPDSIFEAVHSGMQGVVDGGTGRGAKIDGITICGKTGTVENYFRGVKQPNHSFFAAFAPRENPRIAIMCVVENSGRFGGTYAGPISSLMIEKYLNDTISKKRKPLEQRMISTNLIPPLMKQEMNKRDSAKKAQQAAQLLNLQAGNKIKQDETTVAADSNKQRHKNSNLPLPAEQKKIAEVMYIKQDDKNSYSAGTKSKAGR
jgi:penicillin-binding protein 2